MKIHLMLLVIICLAIASCSKDKSIDKDVDNVSVGNDTLVARLHLKITDKQNLIVKFAIFKDSKGNYVIAGEKDKKYWIGYFDGSGNQITVKTYTEDPTEVPAADGSKITVGYNLYHTIKEVNKVIFITRQLRKSKTHNGDEPFIEDLTEIDINSNVITTTYSAVIPGGDVPFTSNVFQWFNNDLTEISKSKIDKDGNILITTKHIYNGQGAQVGMFESPKDLSYTEKPISAAEYVLITSNFHLICKKLNGNAIKFDVNLLADIGAIRSGVINEVTITNNLIAIDYVVVKENGSPFEAYQEIDMSTGKVL